jgi:hypothetical protein
MSHPPRFPPDVARALQEPAGRVRTGSREEGARVVRTSVATLLDVRHWDVELTWDADDMQVRVGSAT